MYGRFVGEPCRAELERFFFLDDADLRRVRVRRGDTQSGRVRGAGGDGPVLGAFLSDWVSVPVGVVRYVAEQVAPTAETGELMRRYAERDKTSLGHSWEIREALGYRDFPIGHPRRTYRRSPQGKPRRPPAGHHRRHAAHRSPAPRVRRVSRTDPTAPDHPHRQTQGPAPQPGQQSTGRLPSTTRRRRTPRPSTKPTPTSPPSRRVPDGPIIAGQPIPPEISAVTTATPNTWRLPEETFRSVRDGRAGLAD